MQAGRAPRDGRRPRAFRAAAAFGPFRAFGTPAGAGAGPDCAPSPARLADPHGPRPRDRGDVAPGTAQDMLADLRGLLARLYGGGGDERVLVRRLAKRITVPVRANVIAHGRRGRLSRAAVLRQVAALNAAYRGRTGGADTGITFRLQSYRVVSNARWFGAPERHERALKAALRRGGPGTLNLYTAAVGADVLGLSTFPQSYRRNRVMDGVVVDYRSVPGGGFPRYRRGYTAVHEVGHWLGLFHTFENGCFPPGDGVADTPDEAHPTDGCPAYKDTCMAPGADPVHNFMDYAWDACMRSFTPGQGRRVRAAWAAYRSGGDKA